MRVAHNTVYFPETTKEKRDNKTIVLFGEKISILHRLQSLRKKSLALNVSVDEHSRLLLCLLKASSLKAPLYFPLFTPNFSNPILYLLLKNLNQLFVCIHQFLLFFDLGYDLALGFDIGKW